MNLVTTCPQCQTAFIVKPEHLAAHRGDVRCGHCQHLFNALEHLAQASDEKTISSPAPDTPESEQAPELMETDAAPADEEIPHDIIPEDAPASEAVVPEADQPQDTEEVDEAELDQVALAAIAAQPLDFELEGPEPLADTPASVEDAPPPTPDTIEPLAEDNPYPRLVDPDLLDAPPEPEPEPEPTPTPRIVRAEADPGKRPSFLEQKPAKSGHRRWLAMLLALLLLLLLTGQLAYFLRTELSVRVPQLKPLLAQACVQLGCKIALPRNIELISIDDSELLEDETRQDVVRLTTTLINQAPYAQAYPNLELTLTDLEDHAVLRRTFAPAEYLSASTAIAQGMPSGEEVHVKLAITTGELKAAGYRVYITYP